MKSSFISLALIFCLLAPILIFANNETQTRTKATDVDRLLGLCKLWGHIKFLHPYLAYRTDIDWDGALIAAIPKVREAKTNEEYVAALQSLLKRLGDPSTHIVRAPPTGAGEQVANKVFEYHFTDDGVLIITVGSYFRLWDDATREKLNALAGEVPKAKTIFFDLRSAEPVGGYGKLQLTSSLSPIERLISSTPYLTVGERVRVSHGFESGFALSSGQYQSGFYTQNVRRVTPAKNAKDIPAVFLLNSNSGVLDSTLSLQAAGKGLIVFEGENGDSSVARSEIVELGDGISASVRISEPILEDGTSGDLEPDVIVPADQKGADAALERSLSLARNFKPSTLLRKKLPPVAAPARDLSYTEMKYPSAEYRLLAGFRIWNTIHYFFPYKSLMGEDWDAVLREFIPKLETSKNALEYSLTVAEMMTRVHDSHAYVSGDVINEHFGTGYPPVRVRLVEDSLAVTHLYDEAAARSAGVEIGDIVLRVDGEDAKSRLDRYAKYISTSTSQSSMDKATLSFMNGKDKSLVSLTLMGRNKMVKEVKLQRKFEDFNTLYHRERSGDIIKLLPGNIGYADLDRLSPDMVDEMLEKFKSTRGIIFDMRGYPNGVFWLLPQRLTEKRDIAAALLETPIVGGNAAGGSLEAFFQNIFPASPDKSIYKGKTVMLIDERSMSQSEHTGLFLRAANGTRFVGSRTSGANGEITTFSVPGGIGIGFSGQSVRFPNGEQLQRIGLIPDIEVKPTIKGLRAGRDEVLDEAVRYLADTK